MEEETVVETPPWEAFKPANSGPWQDFAAPSGPWADFQSAPVDRAMRKADLQAQQAAARSELLPRLAGQLVEPSSPAGIYRDMEQGFAPTRPNTLEQFSQPLANPLNAQTVARGLDVLAGAAEFARQGAVNPNASTAMDERLARDVQPGVGSQIAAGVQQTAAGLTSPAGAGLMAATAGVGALPRLAQRGVSAGFAAWMAANAGTNAGELVNAFEADDVEGFARAATSLGMDATFATLSGLHAVKGIAGDRVPTGNTRPDGTPETRPAAYAQAVNRWLTGQVEKNFTPEQVRDMYRRVNTGEATAQEQELVRVINRQIESPGQALRQGVDVTTPGQSLVSPWLRDFLALTQGEPGVRLAPRQRPANGQQPPVDPAAAPPSPFAGQGERAWVRGLLADRAQPSPPENVPPEAVVPSTAAPAPAGTPLPPPPALNPAPNPAPLEAVSEVPTATAFDPARIPTVEFPLDRLKLSKDVPNFKGGASEGTGTVAGQELTGKYQRTGTAPIVAWERLNGDTEVITGRHRFDLARRTGETTIPTQIVREADGFTKDMALTFDAEANIRDGQGEVADYATYFKGIQIPEAEARARGLLSRAKGRAGWHLAKAATDDVYALWRADKLTDAQAVAIATAAPGDAGAQQIGSKFALQGKPPEFLTNVIKASQAEAGQRAEALDLFGKDDSAMQAMAEQAERASQFQKELAEQIRAVQGAAKRPEVARKLGVDVKDPEGIVNKIAALKAELVRWADWPLQPDLVAKVKGGGVDKAPATKQTKVANENSDSGPELAQKENERLAGDAAEFVGRGGAPDVGERPAPGEIERQSERLVEWARARGLVLPATFFEGLKKHTGTTAEHEVFQRASDQRAIKRTYAGSFGVSPRAHGPGIGATPEFYLRRLALMNQVFDSGLRLEGVGLGKSLLIGKGEEPSLVVSQPWHEAAKIEAPHPTYEQIGEFMRSLGFQPLPKSYFGWWRAADGVRVLDARDDNFILTRKGVVPIDLVLDQPKSPPDVSEPTPPAKQEDFSLAPAESVAEQQARLAQEQAQRDAQAQRDKLAELQAKPLTGTTGDLGQGSLLDAPQDLFAPPSPGGGSANASVGDFRAPVPARPAPVPEVPAGAGFADSGLFVDGVEVRLGGSGAVNPVLMPEVYRIYNALTGGDSPFLRRYRSANGMFYAAGAGRIGLHPDLFKFPHQAAYTFAHEVGHLGDYLPDRTLDRGNLFGSIGTLRHWLTTTFPLNPSTPLDDVLKGPERKKLYSRAYNETKRALGPRPNKEESEVDWAVWGEELSKRYQEMVEEVIDERGLIPLKQVRDELLTLTQWWKPYDPATAPESYRKYRESARELYADALSVLFNSPGHLEQMAPTFYKMFWAWLDTKPEFKAALARTQELLAKGDAEVLRARVADDRADFEKGRAAFEAAHAEQERTFTDVRAITARLMRQLVDRGEALTELSAGPRLGGVLPQGMDPREAWEQMLMADNLIYQFSSAVAERVVKPLQDAGLNADTDIGVYLKHTRIQGNKSAREELDLIKARLGRATYTQAEKFADLMEELVRKGIAETQMIDRVILPAEAAGIEFDDITEISRLRLEQGTRVDIANPRLVQAAESERTLAQYLADLGPAKANVLEQAAAAFRDIVFNLVEQGHAAQVFTDRQLQTAQANRHTYAAFRPLDHVDTWVSWTMRRAKGSAKPIENPFVTTMLKMQGLAQAIMENRAKLATRDAMQPVAPESFVKAETYWTGRGQQAKPPAKDMARLIVREQGKPVAYDVDPAIAEAFEKLTPFEQDTAAAWVNWLFHKTLYRGYVSWSLPFNFWTNPNRDIRRTYLNLGAVFGKRAPSMTDLARAYKDAWADAKAYVAGELTPLSREAMEFYAIYAPTDAFYSQFPQDDPSHAIFVKLGLVAEPASKARAMADKVPVLKQALAVGDWVTRQGQQREAVGKLGTWLALRRAGFEPEQAAPFVRNYAGTPNTKVSGSGSAVPNAIFPFYRIWMQALRNWAKLVRNPKTRGGWMFRWAITAGTLRALLGLAGLGYFGKELKDWIDGVPEYDRTRGVPVPVPPLALPGGDYGKKSLYLRLPDDEFSALMGYSLDNAMRAAAGQKGAGQAASDAAAQWLTSAPALNTFADLTAQWLAYAGNGVPEDRFRNRPVLTEPERKAGGAQAFGKMVAFSLDKAGVPMLRQPASEPGSDAEQVLRFTPLLKDMFKVSDAGFREKDMAQRDAVEQVKYAIRMDYGDDTKYLLHRHAVLDRAGTTRTLAQEAEYAFLKRWHADYNRLDAAIVAAQQQNERGEAKERIRDLETASTAYKTAMEQAKAERERPAGPRAVPWSPRLTNAVPARR